MPGPTYDCSDPDARAEGLSAAARAVRAGRLVVLPTDTVYGIGCDAFSASAVRALLEAKRRGPDMPVPVLVGSWTTIDGLQESLPATDILSGVRVVDEGEIITSAGVSAGIDMALHVVRRLHGDDVAKRTARDMEYEGGR